MSESEGLQNLRDWLVEAFGAIHEQVHVSEVSAATGQETTLKIDHRLACPLVQHDGWRVSTRPTFLPLAHFSSQARHYLKTANAARGRTIYCEDLSVQEVIAAISYHLDDRRDMPVLITGVGIRIDTVENAFLIYRTLAGVLVAKQYLHALADKTGRGGCVDIDLNDRPLEPLVRKLGFETAPRLKGYRPGGIHLRQRSPLV